MRIRGIGCVAIVIVVLLLAAVPAGGVTGTRDRAKAAGLSGFGATETWSAQPFDVDRDGRQDICLVRHDQGIVLWRNLGGGRYTAWRSWPARNAAGKVPDRHDCVAADFDGNGLTDLYVTAGRSGFNLVKTDQDNELWLQGPKGVFTDVGTAWGIGDPCGRSHHAAVLDVNRDGWPDLFVGDALPRLAPDDPCDDPANGLPNEASKLYLNEAGHGFRDVSAAYGVSDYMGPHCAQAADYDGDGWTDILACSAKGLRLFHNEKGTRFVDRAPALGLPAANDSDAVLARVNRDSRPDLVIAEPDAIDVRLNLGDHFGVASTIPESDVRRVAVGDADADGDGDLFVLRSNVPERTNPADVLLLNTAMQFHAVSVPPAPGIGDEVTALDANADHRAEFIVLNGAEDATAPLQLIVLA